MKGRFRCLVLGVGVLLGSVNANANLIINGGFEQVDVGKGRWGWFTSDNIPGWQGSNIEIWDTYGGVQAFEGTQHAELNAHGQRGQPFSIFQTFETEVGATYELSFAYSARRSTNEAFAVNVFSDNQSLLKTLIDDHLVKQWNLYTTEFIATQTWTTLAFNSVNPYAGTVGNFLDAVSVVKSLIAPPTALPGNPQTSSPVAEPAMTLLMLLFGSWLFMRRRTTH